MHVVMVDVKVLTGTEAEFVKATVENARQSRQEPGIAAFDLLVNPTDATHFMLVEVYRTAEASLAHKETPHYATWRDTVQPMMKVPRTSVKWKTEDAKY